MAASDSHHNRLVSVQGNYYGASLSSLSSSSVVIMRPDIEPPREDEQTDAGPLSTSSSLLPLIDTTTSAVHSVMTLRQQSLQNLI
jgi:hypothetical protein